jgi:hypothetical protein
MFVHIIIGVSVGASLLLFSLVPLAHWILNADARYLRKEAVRKARQEERAQAVAKAAIEAALAEKRETERIQYEAEQMALYAHHAPFVDEHGDRWGRTKRTPPPWM